MKTIVVRILSALMIMVLFFGCQNPAFDNKTEGQSSQQGNSSESGATKTDVQQNRLYSVKFDFSNAQALAKLEAKQDGSRAVTNADELGELVKILANGSMENAITVDENCYLSDIVAVYKSPIENSKDIFIVFNGESTIGYEEIEKTYEWGGTYTGNQSIRVGQLICVHEDGSIADILKKEDSTDSWNNHYSLKTESVTFDAAGNLYFISCDNGDMIYQYDSKTCTLLKMVAAVDNTYYQRMQIDDNGQWIFVSGYRSSSSNSYFLRAIPISNPNGFKNIYYSSDSGGAINNWVYDNKNGVMYYLASSGNQEGLWRAAKKDGFKNEYISYNTSVGDENYTSESIFNSFQQYYNNNYWGSSYLDENDEFSAAKAVDNLCARYYSIGGYEKETKNYIRGKEFTREELDVRFDKFENETGELRVIYLLTKGKKNEDALNALNCWEGKMALYSLQNSDYFSEDNGKGYRHNLLAEILYIKDTDILLSDSTDVILSYYQSYEPLLDENGDHVYNSELDQWEYVYSDEKELTGKDFFAKKANGNYENSDSVCFIGSVNHSEDYPKIVNYSFAKEQSQVLDYLFSFCDVEGEKEFRLYAFKDDPNYSCLYSNLTDEDALEWLSLDIERLSFLGKAMGLSDYDKYIDNEYIYGYWIDYNSLINFIAKTCYIKGTEQKGVSEIREQMLRIPYSYNDYSSYLYDSSGKGSLSVTDQGVFYQFTNLYNNWYSSSSSKPYYFIVQLTDSDGAFVEKVKEIALPMGKVVKSLESDNRIFMQYSLLDESGGELGYHQIYSVDLSTGDVINHFENVPNRKSLEVITYNSAGSNLYFSAVRGTTVENMIVNIVTNEYNPLSVQRKMVAVYTFN